MGMKIGLGTGENIRFSELEFVSSKVKYNVFALITTLPKNRAFVLGLNLHLLTIVLFLLQMYQVVTLHQCQCNPDIH